MTKTQTIELAIQRAKLALEYLRLARHESQKVYEDAKATRTQTYYAAQYLSEAEKFIAPIADVEPTPR
jgi:hypothetical protein